MRVLEHPQIPHEDEKTIVQFPSQSEIDELFKAVHYIQIEKIEKLKTRMATEILKRGDPDAKPVSGKDVEISMEGGSVKLVISRNGKELLAALLHPTIDLGSKAKNVKL